MSKKRIKDQWNLWGVCILCRKKKYCGKKCKKKMDRKHLTAR